MTRWIIPALVVLIFPMAAPAQGAPLEREHYSGTDTFDFDDCGS